MNAYISQIFNYVGTFVEIPIIYYFEFSKSIGLNRLFKVRVRCDFWEQRTNKITVTSNVLDNDLVRQLWSLSVASAWISYQSSRAS